MKLKKKVALVAAGSLISVGGLYAVTASANAAPSSTPVVTLPTTGAEIAAVGDADNVQEGDQSTVDNATESSTETASDGADVGADVNASEPGHQDAAGADDATEAQGAEGSADEVSAK